MSVCCAGPSPLALSTAARPSVSAPADTVGRHRRTETTGARIGRAFDLVAQLGSLVTVAALLVVAGAAAGLVGGISSDHVPTITVTFDHNRH